MCTDTRSMPLLRSATPEDATFLAWAISTAARGAGRTTVWEHAMARTEAERQQFLELLVVAEPECAVHYSGFVIAEFEGQAIAAACGFIPHEKSPEAFTQAMLDVATRLGWSEHEQLALLNGFSVFNRCLPMTRSDRWVLEYVAALPSARGKGTMSAILDDLLECGREAGAQTAQVAYFLGNEPARKLYQKLGFKESVERRDPEFETLFGSPGVVEMIYPL